MLYERLKPRQPSRIVRHGHGRPKSAFRSFFYYPNATSDAAIISVDQESGASGEIRTLKHRYSNSRTLALWCTAKDLNLRVPLGETGLQPVRFSRAHAPVQAWRKVDESNAHRSSRCPGFQDQLPAIQQYLPFGGEYGS